MNENNEPKNLEQHARNRMLYLKEGSSEWCFWRGVCLGIESCTSNNHTSNDWADSVAKQFRGNY